MQRQAWIDRLRGLAMVLILLFHTEVYYTGAEIIPYHLYVCNALALFFYLSGWLFCPPDRPIAPLRKLRSIWRGLLVPYFFFTLMIGFPKAWAHEGTVRPLLVAVQVVTGRASWFVAALVVAQLLFLFMLWSAQRCRWLTPLLVVLCVAVAALFGNHTGSCVGLFRADPWYLAEALVAVCFLYAGRLHGAASREAQQQQLADASHGSTFNAASSARRRLWSMLAALLAVATLKYAEHRWSLQMLFAPLTVSSMLVFLTDTLCSSWLLVQLFRAWPAQTATGPTGVQAVLLRGLSWPGRGLAWVGRHSLVCYFFCGAVPMLVSRLLAVGHLLPYNGHYARVLVVFLLVCLFTSAVAAVCHRCLPFLK